MGRPLSVIDQKQFESLCGLQCTIEEICAFFGVTDKTLSNWCRRTYKKSFSEVFAEKRGAGKISLRRKQMQVALDGNPTMLIWLGRNYLGQSERIEAVVESKNGQLENLIAGLKDNNNDIHSETT